MYEQVTIFNLQEVRRNWIWFLLLGIAQLVLGTIALTFSLLATLATVLVFGILLLIGGGFQLVQALRSHRWRGFFLHLFAAVLDLVLGVLMVTRPAVGAVDLTLVIAAFLVVGGSFRAIGALMLRLPNWGWALLAGVVSAVLGVLLMAQWPVSGLWFIGFCVGLDMIFHGWGWVMLAFSARTIRPEAGV